MIAPGSKLTRAALKAQVVVLASTGTVTLDRALHVVAGRADAFDIIDAAAALVAEGRIERVATAGHAWKCVATTSRARQAIPVVRDEVLHATRRYAAMAARDAHRALPATAWRAISGRLAMAADLLVGDSAVFVRDRAIDAAQRAQMARVNALCDARARELFDEVAS